MTAFKLKIVSFVLHHHADSGASQHIEPIISSFLGPDSSLALHKAVHFNSLELLNWIWESSCTLIEERSSGWSLTNYLRSDTHYYKWMFSKSLEEIVSSGDMRLMQWIYDHFSACQVPNNVVETAAGNGNLELLQFLWNQQDKNKVDWSGEALKKAVEGGHRHVSLWLYEHAPYNYDDTELLRLSQGALRTGDVDFALVLLPPHRNIFLEAGTSWRPGVIEWMLDHGYYTREMEKAAGIAIWKLASQGRLDLIQRIVELYPPPWMNEKQWLFKDWYNAIAMACSGGHLEVVQWLVEHPNGQKVYLRRQSGQQALVWAAAGNGHVTVMEYIYEHWRTGDSSSIVIPLGSSVSAIKWLIDHYPTCVRQSVVYLVKNAAKTGNLELLQLFHELDSSAESATLQIPLTQRSWWPKTVHVMNFAPANGHLDILEWLQENRQEECSTSAMDEAAANGHLKVVQWLGANRPETCTLEALNRAACNGHLEVVQWLHSTLGCTQDTFDLAATHGHLEVVKWLYINGADGSTSSVLKAIEGGHIKVAGWILTRSPECLPTKITCLNCPNSDFDALLFLHVHNPILFTRAFVRIIKRERDSLIVNWLDETYPI
ncbi:hypothetical protein L915_00644 [Phytophthora nicotianae]|uniref:Uncharacterized protein n=3 Tax=Phytophthora nicotianae TaxID=4792 RepID=V9FZK8_PHYNI|nr:hypothetical protein F443_00703 [Phytophthora nicotianae P1569]ETK96700.1 hypothetical protein L915_00644 [Phytophthora nicotianae]ETO85685.1 hypothetical protein F444_00690 [Phytophthora nicotianae P1976]